MVRWEVETELNRSSEARKSGAGSTEANKGEPASRRWKVRTDMETVL